MDDFSRDFVLPNIDYLPIIAEFYPIPLRFGAIECDGGKGEATPERTTSNTRHTIGDNNGGEGVAILESSLSNTRHTIGDNNGGKGFAILESSLSNTRHTIGDNNGGKGGAIPES